MTLEQMLVDMARFGPTTLTQFDSGLWFCYCEPRVNACGVVFKVKSKGKHATPTEAATECHANLLAAIEQLSPKETQHARITAG